MEEPQSRRNPVASSGLASHCRVKEWERPRAGPMGNSYPWGSESNLNRANYEDTGINATGAVGCFQQEPAPTRLRSEWECLEWMRSLW
jgi:hypothetical protein